MSTNKGKKQHRTGRRMTRQEREKQLRQRMLITAAVIAAAILVLVFSVCAAQSPEKTAEAPQADTAEVQSAEISGTETAVQNTEAAPQETAGAEAAGEETAVQETAASEGTVTAAGTQAGTAAPEEEEVPAPGNSMADQSLVEKLSVEAKKNLETEKIRQEKEEEERRIQAEEAARKAEVKDKDELMALPTDELVEYLRNKDVPEELIGFMYEYPETKEFVIDYLFQPETPPSMDISGEVVKGQFPHFLQWDERWGYKDYGGSFFAVAGCGPTALSVVYSGLSGKADMNPYVMSQWAEEQGYYIVGSGTSWEMMWNGASKLGLYNWEVDNEETEILTTLRNGFPIIAAVTAGGDFTNFGHFIVLVGADDYGNIEIRDSNSIERTQRTWTYDELYWQTAELWAYNYVDEEDYE